MAGDGNTSLFHQSIKSGNTQNQVYSIHDMGGVWKDNPADMSYAFLTYYTSLIGVSQPSKGAVLKHIVHNGLLVNDQHRPILNTPYIKDEVKQALLSKT